MYPVELRLDLLSRRIFGQFERIVVILGQAARASMEAPGM